MYKKSCKSVRFIIFIVKQNLFQSTKNYVLFLHVHVEFKFKFHRIKEEMICLIWRKISYSYTHAFFNL
jgi:hypothetical protein